jgi:hypothetical protein
MSCKELRRAGVLARVESGDLKLVDAAVVMGVSYRQSKRLARRYGEMGTERLKQKRNSEIPTSHLRLDR